MDEAPPPPETDSDGKAAKRLDLMGYLFAVLRDLPADTLIGGHPRRMNNISLWARRFDLRVNAVAAKNARARAMASTRRSVRTKSGDSPARSN
jgi:hypothetical protein